MSITNILDLRAAETLRLARTRPLQPSDTVVVKLRTTARSIRRLSVAAELESPSADSSQPILASLLERGYVSEIIPVFPIPQPFAEARDSARVLAAAVRDSPSGLKRARGLVSVKLDRGTNAEALAEHLSQQVDEVEYAYVPPVKHLFSPPRRTTRRPRRITPGTGDPLASRQWNHGAVRIHQARERQGFIDASGVLIAIVDSGIDRDHPDLDGVIKEYINFHSATEDDRDYVGHGTHFAQNLEYDSWPGTSMATPHVAAAAALLLAKSPDLSPEAVRKRLRETADFVPGQTRRNNEYGAGRLNIATALA